MSDAKKWAESKTKPALHWSRASEYEKKAEAHRKAGDFGAEYGAHSAAAKAARNAGDKDEAKRHTDAMNDAQKRSQAQGDLYKKQNAELHRLGLASAPFEKQKAALLKAGLSSSQQKKDGDSDGGKSNTYLAEAKEHASNAELLKHRFGDFRVAAEAHREAAEKYKQAGDVASYRKHAVEAKKTHEQHANGYSSASVGPYSQWKDVHARGGNEGDGDEGGSYSHWKGGSK